MIRNIIIPAVLIIALFGLLFGLTMPLYKQVQQAQTAINATRQEIINKQNLLSVIEELERQFGSLEKDVSKISVAIPKQEELPELLVMMPLLVGQSGLSLGNIAFGGVGLEKGHHAVPISLSVSGSYSNMQNFLRSIEQNLRIIDLTSMDFSIGASRDIFNANMALKTYFQ